MTKLAKRLTAALTTAAVLVANLITTVSAYEVDTGREGRSTVDNYEYNVSSVTHYVKYEAGSFYSDYQKYVDGYSALEKYQPSGTSVTIKEIKTHGVLRQKGTILPPTLYTTHPLTDGSPYPFGSNAYYEVTASAAYTSSGNVAINLVRSIERSSTANSVEVSTYKQTGVPLTVFGSISFSNQSTTIAGYYEVYNY